MNPGLSQIHCQCVVQKEQGKYLERVVCPHKLLPMARIGPDALSAVAWPVVRQFRILPGSRKSHHECISPRET
jgi:hypothetical protein